MLFFLISRHAATLGEDNVCEDSMRSTIEIILCHGEVDVLLGAVDSNRCECLKQQKRPMEEEKKRERQRQGRNPNEEEKLRLIEREREREREEKS